MSFVLWVFYGICWLLSLLFWMKSMLTFCHFLALHAFEQFHHRYFALSSGTPQKCDNGNIPKKSNLYASCMPTVFQNIPAYTIPIPSLSHPYTVPLPSLYQSLYHPIPPYTTLYQSLYHPIPPYTTLYHPYTIPLPSLYHPIPPYTTLYHPIPSLYHPIPPYTTLYHPYTTLYHPIPPYTTLYNPHTIPIPSPYQLYISLYQSICRFHICAVFRWTKQQLRKKAVRTAAQEHQEKMRFLLFS